MTNALAVCAQAGLPEGCEILLDGKSYYEVLGVDPTASEEEIGKAFWEKTQRGPELDEDEEYFEKLSKAYSVLMNPQMRAEYDALLRISTLSSTATQSLLSLASAVDHAYYEIIAREWEAHLMRVNNRYGTSKPEYDDADPALFAKALGLFIIEYASSPDVMNYRGRFNALIKLLDERLQKFQEQGNVPMLLLRLSLCDTLKKAEFIAKDPPPNVSKRAYMEFIVWLKKMLDRQ